MEFLFTIIIICQYIVQQTSDENNNYHQLRVTALV